jgi:hypothetical protein
MLICPQKIQTKNKDNKTTGMINDYSVSFASCNMLKKTVTFWKTWEGETWMEIAISSCRGFNENPSFMVTLMLN